MALSSSLPHSAFSVEEEWLGWLVNLEDGSEHAPTIPFVSSLGPAASVSSAFPHTKPS